MIKEIIGIQVEFDMLLFVFYFIFLCNMLLFGSCENLDNKTLVSLALFEHKLIFTWSFLNIYRLLKVNTKMQLLALGENLTSMNRVWSSKMSHVIKRNFCEMNELTMKMRNLK